ncbi:MULTISPECIES: phosphorylcholine transferase LicD [Clostridia]|uniref:LicD family protein n=1 Tax=Clostridia TaxID=186801 RepID=UPI00067EF724|nr:MULTISPECIES: LicD family protein [Clostridia]
MDTQQVLHKMHDLHLILADELKHICEKNDIKYFLIAGSLLGAVRHQGFIPWDDDMDFGMKRNDFEKFIKVCEKEIDCDKFYLQYDRNDKYYTFNFAKLALRGTKVIEAFSDKVNTETGIYIDIFPIDNLSDKAVQRIVQLKSFFIVRNLLWIKCGYGNEERKKELSYKIGKIGATFFNIEMLKKWKHTIITRYKDENTALVVTSDGNYGLKKETLKSDWVESIREYRFEDRSFPGIADYKSYLSYFYGDYMELPPIEERNHHGRLDIDFGIYE